MITELTNATPSRIHTWPNPLLWLNVLSLDAPLVAVLWQDFFARTFSARLDAAPRLALGLATWVIYAADRWFDAWKIPDGAEITPRHRFARQHRTALAFVCALALCGTAVFAWLSLSVVIFERGAVLTLAVAVYFLLNQSSKASHFLRGFKEVAIGIIFAAGTVIATEPRAHAYFFGWACAAWGLLVILNCYAIGCWELKTDREARQESLATRWPFLTAHFRKAAAGVMLFALTPLLFRCSVTIMRFGFAVAASSGGLAVLDWYSGELDADFLRSAADLVLFTPLLFRFF